MARYPQGVTSFIPAYQAYQPDFTMMGKMLSIRQNQYDQNWKKLNNVYGSLLYADTTHEQSQEVKDQLKNEIDFNLRRVSGLDLSLEQNVAAAQQVFQPFYENTSLMYDMAATKNISAARSKAESYKNSVDPKYQELYWNKGMDEINYRVQEFKETPYDQIQSSGLAQVNYTPNFNIAKEAMALAKDFGDMKVPSSDGKYDYVTTNGQQIQGYLQKLFQTSIGQDPRAQAKFRTEAYVDRKNFVNSQAANFGGDKEAAERSYLEESYRVLAQGAVQRKNSSEKNTDALKDMLKLLSDPSSSFVVGKDKAMQELTEKYQISEADLQNAKSTADVATTNEEVTFKNIEVLRNKVDFLKANSLMGKAIGEQAGILSMRNYEKTSKLNEEYKMAIEQQNKMNLKFMEDGVAKGTHRLTKDANGNVSIEEIKSANSWSQFLDRTVSGGDTDQAKLFKELQTNDFKLISSYLNEGFGIVESLSLDQIDGFQKDMFDGISEESRKKLKKQLDGKDITIEDIRLLTSDYEAFEKSGLTYHDLNSINTSMAELIFNNDTYSTILDTKYPKGAERDAVTNWHNNSIKANNIITMDIHRKNYMVKKLQEIQDTAPAGSPLNFISFAVDAYGNDLDPAGYRRAVAKAQGNKGLEAMFADMDMDAATEQRIRDAADKAWDENSGFFNKNLWTQFVAPKLDAFFNTYKLRDGIPFNYINPFDWGKYNLGRYFKQKLSMPDYEDVIDAKNDAMKNSLRFKGDPMPGTRGEGTGSSGMSSYATVVAGAGHTKPYKDFYGGSGVAVSIADDAKNIMAQGPGNVIYSAFGTTADVTPDEEGKMVDDDINTELHQETVKRLWEYAVEEINNTEMGNMQVIVKPGTQFSGNKGGYTIKFDKEFLEKFIQKQDADENLTTIGFGDGNIMNDIFKNGATIITDKGNMDSDTWEAGNMDHIEGILKYKYGQNLAENSKNPAPASQTYSFGNGYKTTFEMYGSPSEPKFRVKNQFPLFDVSHYVNTGDVKNETAEVSNVNPRSLTSNLDLFQNSTIDQYKQYNAKTVSQVQLIIQALRKRNPNISQGEILRVLENMGYGTI
jgi:hypothetical protein